jgi:hypothetical protein
MLMAGDSLPLSERHDPTGFYIPEFQRSLVWPKEKREKLIQSIIRGYPVGALLVVEHDEKTKVALPDGTTAQAVTYGIIDGLQRTNAIADHLAAPLKGVTEDVLDSVQVDELAKALATESGQSVSTEDVEDALMTWLHATEVTDEEAGFEHDAALETLVERLSLAQLSMAQARRLKPRLIAILKHVRNAVDISDHKIPVLVFKGDRADLPEIFDRINSQGTVLSKYEVFAAAWVNCHVKITDPEIVKAIDGRYSKLKAEGFTILRTHTGASYSLFDYFYGLSQVMGKRYPRLFSKADASRGRSSVAFPLAALVLGKPVDAMAKLPDLLERKKDGTYELADLEKAILDAAGFVDQVLANFLGLHLKKEGDALAHGELQMASIVAAASTYLFDAKNKLKKRGLSAANRKKLEIAIPQHYLNDILRQEWRGSLYTYAYSRVWKSEYARSDYYTTPIPKKTFLATMSSSLGEQLLLVSHARRNISAADRAVLKFVYSGLVSAGEQAANDFDIEHLIPVDRIVKMTHGGDAWALGALGNLAILPAPTNRRKRTETVNEYLGRTARKPDAETTRLVKKLALVPVAQVSIPQAGGKDAMTSLEYLAFVKSRWKEMTELLQVRLQVT